jgi:hypothetical protein
MRAKEIHLPAWRLGRTMVKVLLRRETMTPSTMAATWMLSLGEVSCVNRPPFSSFCKEYPHSWSAAFRLVGYTSRPPAVL